MTNYTVIKNRDLKLNIIDVNIYKNFSLHDIDRYINYRQQLCLSNNDVEYMEAEIVLPDSHIKSDVPSYNYEVLFDYEFRSKEIDDKLLKLRENLLERSNPKSKGLISKFKKIAKNILSTQ